APPSYAELEGFAAGSRVARGQSRATVEVREDGIALDVEPLSGQKTGMFIDQRETRARVGALARGARVLDLYAYAGGFSLAAARGGAKSVTAVDSSARAVARTLAHAEKNGVAVEAVEADAFRFLETATPRSFDLLVVDPPKFARARKDLDAARKGYERLNALAMQAAAPGAILVTCSCSQNVDAETFERIVAAGAKQSGREVRVFERRGPASDHLLPPGFGEGQYLKVLLCYVV
ncbi:MAG: class I SAM-dependent methyltransferase, partial [Pseudomonadota bacterium]